MNEEGQSRNILEWRPPGRRRRRRKKEKKSLEIRQRKIEKKLKLEEQKYVRTSILST